MSRAFSSNLKGKVRNFHLPKNRPLVPLYEAIVNSINAIDERKQLEEFDGQIEVEVLRDRTLLSEADTNTIRGFRVVDNGIGFTSPNMSSFMEADSDYKLSIGGKGVGRFSWLKAFVNISVKSTYKEDDEFVTREFEFSLDKSEIDDTLSDAGLEEYRTEICLNDYLKDYEKNVPKQLGTIAARIIQHCFAYFLRSDCPRINLFDGEDRISLNQMFSDGVQTDENQTYFNIGIQRFRLLNIKITDRTFVKKNRLFLCANERLVYSKEVENKIVNLDSGIFDKEGYWYIGILTGKYLDDNVDMNRLSFDLPTDSSLLLPDNPGLDEIEAKACEKIADFLKDYLADVEQEKQERIEKYTTEIAPQYRHLSHYAPDKIAALKPGLSDEALDDALYGIKRDFENKTKTDCKELLKRLDRGDISSEEYQNQFQETIEKVSDVNRAALAD